MIKEYSSGDILILNASQSVQIWAFYLIWW